MNTFETIILISMASLGFRCITDKGMIFYFLRGWLDRLKESQPRKWLIKKDNLRTEQLRYEREIEEIRQFEYSWRGAGGVTKEDQIVKWRMKIQKTKNERQSLKKHKFTPFLLYCMKPIILCGTCMSSVHTLIWWPILVGEYTLFTIVTMLSVAFLNTLLYLIIEKLQGK